MTLIVKLLAVLLLLTLLRMLLMRFFGSPRRPRPAMNREAARQTITGQMVKDPQCGMYIASSLAIPVRTSGETYFFCSDKCKTAYLREQASRH